MVTTLTINRVCSDNETWLRPEPQIIRKQYLAVNTIACDYGEQYRFIESVRKVSLDYAITLAGLGRIVQ